MFSNHLKIQVSRVRAQGGAIEQIMDSYFAAAKPCRQIVHRFHKSCCFTPPDVILNFLLIY